MRWLPAPSFDVFVPISDDARKWCISTLSRLT
jgi:hypothetical protein